MSLEKYSVLKYTHIPHPCGPDNFSDSHKALFTSFFNFFRRNSTLDIYNVITIVHVLFIQLFAEKELGIFSPDNEHLFKINFDTVKKLMSLQSRSCGPILNFYGSNVIYVALIGFVFVNESRQSFIITRNLV